MLFSAPLTTSVLHAQMFNGNIVGPTIRVSPGDTFSVTLVNNLPLAGFSTASLHNEFKTMDVTNLHTHGLHVSSAAPGDDVFTEVGAGVTYTYTYVLPANHMGGTFFSPPHAGSASIGAGGGAAGLLIVEDLAGALPPEVPLQLYASRDRGGNSGENKIASIKYR